MNNVNETVEQLDPTEDLPIEVVKKRAIRGAAILTARTIFIQVISFTSIALLTYFLEPLEFGVFFLVSAVINFLKYFSDIGFAAALIQKKEALTNEQLKTIFTVQQILISAILIFIFFSTALIRDIYNFDQDSIYLLWALAFSLLLSSLKTIPSVMLERRLEFNKLVIPEIVETIVFNVTTVYLAWRGFGVTSFTVGVILRGFSGLITVYFIQPWVPGLAFSKKALSSLLKFGIPYQVNTFLAMAKDDGMTLFLGGILGPSGIGFLGWAQKWAYAPLRFFMDQVIRVTFPAFSRLQGNRKELSDTVAKAIFFICLLVFPTLVLLVLLAPVLTEVIPKYNKWNPALFALTLISATSALAAITTPLTNMLNAIGKIAVTFKLMVMWTVLTWALVPILSILYGLNGAAAGFALVGLSSIVGIIVASRFIDINYLQIVGKPLTASILMGILVFILQRLLPLSFFSVILLVVTGLFLYGLTVIVMEPKLLTLVKSLKLFKVK